MFKAKLITIMRFIICRTKSYGTKVGESSYRYTIHEMVCYLKVDYDNVNMYTVKPRADYI